jgi:hypothetical protein
LQGSLHCRFSATNKYHKERINMLQRRFSVDC